MRRLALLSLAALAASVAGACSSVTSPSVATVNGDEISKSELDDDLAAVEDDEQFRAFVESQLQLTSAGTGDGTFDSGFVAEFLTTQIYYSLVEEELARRDVEVGDAEISAVEQQVGEQGLAQLEGLPAARRTEALRQVALIQAIGQVLPEYVAENEDTFASQCVSHILVSTAERSDADARARADDLSGQLDDGASFRELAREESDDPAAAAEGGDLGCGPRGRFVPEFEDAAYGLEVDEVSDPVKTEFGYHLIRVRGREPIDLEQLDAEARQQVLGLIQQTFLEDLVEAADVELNPRYGTWANPDDRPLGNHVVPPEGPEPRSEE